jgi:hypothetical protein
MGPCGPTPARTWRGRGADVLTCPHGRAWTRVVLMQLSVRGDAGLGGQNLELRLYKGELSPFFLTSNQSLLNSWGLKRCVHTSFFLDQIAGFLVGSPLQTGGGEVFQFCRFFISCWFEDVGPRGFLGGPEGQI